MMRPRGSSSSTRAAVAIANPHSNGSGQSSSTSSSSHLAFAIAATALATAGSSLNATRRNNPTKNEAISHQNADADMLALGKSLQASHERQMVRMAKLLHSLETLAEEAEKDEKKKELDKQQQQSEKKDGNDATTNTTDNGTTTAAREEEEEKQEETANTEMICISDAELDALSSSPDLVWGYIESLKNGAIYGREDVKRIARAASTALRSEPSLIDLSKRCASKENGGDLETVTVVGDLHGHFQCSLVKILDMLSGKSCTSDEDEHGSPWDGTGAVVFNGDFVDRGQNSVEVLLALLLLKLAYPNNVYLNRGNHEDSVIAEVYGCKDELQARYGQDTKEIWEEFENAFASLPIAVVTDSAVIMHGGLPNANFRVEQINEISSEERSRIKTMVEPAKNDETCKLMQNIMWSDPQPDSGMSPNEERGCGMRYGPDVVRSFLADHGLKYLIRSHEAVDEGYELLECDEHGMSAVTVFSAASYPGGAGFNYGAIVRLRDGNVTFDSYNESDGENKHGLTMQEKMNHTFKAFAEVIAANRAALEEEFEYMAEKRARRRRLRRTFSSAEDGSMPISQRMNAKPVATSALPVTAQVDDDDCITPESWADAMNFVLNAELPDVDWLSIQRFIAPGEIINYKRFLNLQCSLTSYDASQSTGMDDNMRNTIMQNHEAIFKVFKFLDEDGSGELDRDEFCNGINKLKERNPDSAISFDAEALFDSIDNDGSGTIELSEFQHAFQAVDVPYYVAVMMTLDMDKSGTIDRQEFHEGVKLLNARLSESEKIPDSVSEINMIFDELDEDGSGDLDMAEFEKFMRDYYPH